MSSSRYQRLPQESSSEDPDQEIASPEAIEMGKALGTFRAWFLVSVCSMGSFLFAYVRAFPS